LRSSVASEQDLDVEAHVYSLVQETLVRDLLYESDVALLVVDDEMRILVANQAASELSGYSADELAKLQSWQITGDPEQSAKNALRVHLGGRLAAQSTVRHKDGHLVTCSYFAWEVTIGSLPFIAILLWPEGTGD
jgi:PAS domain S-box-containing protein